MASIQNNHDNRKNTAQRVLGILFALVYAVALVPTVYIGATQNHEPIAGIPVSIWYMLLVSAAAIALTYALWVVERRQKAMD